MSREDARAPLRVVYEDSRILAADKPAGQPVIPARGAARSEPLSAQVSAAIGSKAFVVHRIDKDTSGLVLFAKDPRTHRILCGLFESREVRKAYLALVGGNPPREGRIELPLREFGSGRIAPDPARGKPSLTLYQVRERFSDAALLEARPLTGRRHQIRSHLSAIGCPIIGDVRYGGAAGPPRPMLHAWKLAFSLESAPVELTAEAPADFLEASAKLRGR